MSLLNKNAVASFEREVGELVQQHKNGDRMSPVYQGSSPVFVGNDLVVCSTEDQIYNAYYAIRLFELWDDVLESLLTSLAPSHRPSRQKGRFDWFVKRDCITNTEWREMRNGWVHEGVIPAKEDFESLVNDVRAFILAVRARKS